MRARAGYPAPRVVKLKLFAVTIFLGAGLLFLVQPMVARLLLPLLGGSPAVWNTCMVFFQAALLAGYAYAHWSIAVLGPRRQALLHTIVVLAPLALLPIALPGSAPPTEGSPIPWLIATLAAMVGLPFFAIASAGPVLQRWFAATDHPDAKDPYFLYAASNAGSLLGLLAYPLALEPWLGLRNQSLAFAAGYGLFAIGTLACAATMARRPARGANAPPAADASAAPTQAAPPADRITWRRRGLWVLLAAVPSSLMLGTTQYLSTDIAAIPLLWVLPLGLYLLTFIVAFSRRATPPIDRIGRLVPIVAVALALSMLMEARRPAAVLILLHLAMLLLGALLCHTRLAAARPGASRLTEYYLLISVGGVLGGVFNSLLAPLLFDAVLEYPIAIALVCLLRPGPGEGAGKGGRTGTRGEWAVRLGLPAGLLVFLLIAGSVLRTGGISAEATLWRGAAFGLAALVCYLFAARPAAFALGLAVLVTLPTVAPLSQGRVLERSRTFFGVYRVTETPGAPIRAMHHGTTVHGVQLTDPRLTAQPSTYYHPSGPIGELFRRCKGDPRLGRVGLVGLGVGSLAAYAEPGHRWTFYEIDPEVVRLAREHFTYLRDTRGEHSVVLGDGRLALAAEPDGAFGLIVLDAFSSDAIPVHLLTREAVELYRRKLRPGGVLAFHISNRHLTLWPVLGAIRAELGMAGAIAEDDQVTPLENREGKSPSTWLLLAERPEAFEPLEGSTLWHPFEPGAGGPLWTDDYSNLLSVFDWR